MAGLSAAIAALLFAFFIDAAQANSIQPPLAHNGAAGGPGCQACHGDGPLNPPEGHLVLEGLPEQYVAGYIYDLRVTLHFPLMARAGFQFSARFASGRHTGEQAGTLTAPDNRVDVMQEPESQIQFAQHTEAGLPLVMPEQNSWNIQWQAPTAQSGAVIFHIAANGANYDDSEFGDTIFLLKRTSKAPDQ